MDLETAVNSDLDCKSEKIVFSSLFCLASVAAENRAEAIYVLYLITLRTVNSELFRACGSVC